jgi:pimeloyl-ACP methyl ester carboxylesterase
MDNIHQQLVTFETNDKIELDGLLVTPNQQELARKKDILFLFIHGLAMNFYCPFFIKMVSILAKSGYSALTANNRGHDLTSTRQGFFEKQQGALWELFPDSYLDLLAAIEFSHSIGYKHLVLVGHSLGGLKAVYYQSITRDESVHGVVLLSPVRSMRSLYKYRLGESFERILRKAKENIEQGQGDRVISLDPASPYSLSSKTIVSYMGDESIANLYLHIEKVIPPILLMIDEREKDTDLNRMALNMPNLEIRRVFGADHFYSGKENQVVEIIGPWLNKY